MAFVTLAFFMLAVAALWSLALMFFMARHLLRPRRMTDVRALNRVGRMTPADIGLAFTPMNFTVRDAHANGTIRLAGWWLPAGSPSDKTAIVVHGYGDAKIGGIAWAPGWHALGWNVLAIDLRAHGESEGAHCTAGFYERDDLDQIIDALRLEKTAATTQIALFGVSLGAACVAACAARRDDIAAVVMESPYSDYRDAVTTHVRRSGFPLVFATPTICLIAEWLSGADFRDVMPKRLIPDIAAPLMIIHGDADALADIPATAAACALRPAERLTRHDVWPGVPHIMALASDPEKYLAALEEFLNPAVFMRSEVVNAV